MANRTLSINPDHPAYNKKLFALLNNGEDTDDPMVGWRLYRVVCTITDTGVLTVAAPSANVSDTVDLEGDTSHTISLHTALDTYLFPSRVIRGPAYVEVKTAVDVVTTPTITLGDAGAADGLVTAAVGTLDSTGFKFVNTAAEYASQPEAAFVPQIVIASGGGNLDTITAGAFEVVIAYAPLPF